MAVLRSSREDSSSQTVRLPAKDTFDSDSRSERHTCPQTFTTTEETPKDPPASSLFTEPLTPEYTSLQQQSSDYLQPDLSIGEAVSGESPTAENPSMALSALKNLSNDQRTTDSPSRGCQPADSFAKNPLTAEDLTILVTEVISTSISKRTFEEMNDSVIILADDEDEPLFKRYKVEAISYINSLIKKTKAEQAIQTERLGDNFGDDAIHGAIMVNKRTIAEAIEKFYDVYNSGLLDAQSEPGTSTAKRLKFLGFARDCTENIEIFQLQELDLCFMSCTVWTSRPTAATLTDYPEPSSTLTEIAFYPHFPHCCSFTAVIRDDCAERGVSFSQVARLIASIGHMRKIDDFNIKLVEQHSFLLTGFSWHTSSRPLFGGTTLSTAGGMP